MEAKHVLVRYIFWAYCLVEIYTNIVEQVVPNGYQDYDVKEWTLTCNFASRKPNCSPRALTNNNILPPPKQLLVRRRNCAFCNKLHHICSSGDPERSEKSGEGWTFLNMNQGSKAALLDKRADLLDNKTHVLDLNKHLLQ